MKKKPIFGLSCAGGGAHGAYQVGVLKYIHEHFSDNGRSPFQVFTGASCGALNTTFYAAQSFDAYKSRLWLEELWLSFHVPDYHGNFLKNVLLAFVKEMRKHAGERHPAWALLDPTPMRKILEKGFRRESLDRSLREGSTLGLAIAATEMVSGRTCWFQEGPHSKKWNLFHSIGLHDKLDYNHLAASCSVPLFLPPVKLGDHYFVDGSVSLIRPLSTAVSMGATRILSIATDKPYSSELPAYKVGFRPTATKIIRLLLNRLSHDAAGDEAYEIEAFNRFYQGLSKKSRKIPEDLEPVPLFHENSRPYHYHETEIFRFLPSKRIRLSSDLDDVSTAHKHHHRTRFMFHENFIRELIAMGYHDARDKHDSLRKFFIPEETHPKRWFFFKLKKLV
jgi:NTE family protein